MAELIRCRSCDSPNCRGCNVYILDQALHYGKLDWLKDGNKTIRIPTAGVRPVLRGEWIWAENEDEYEQYFVCSICGEHNFYEAKYCPDCGAYMRG